MLQDSLWLLERVPTSAGGHCVKIALDITHQVIKELASNQVR